MKKKLKLKPVSEANWSDFEALFESPGGPKYCWCMAWRSTEEELKKNDSRHRKSYIKKRVADGIPIGLLAYQGDTPVAWCSVAPRETYRTLGGDGSLHDVWSLVCFFIKKDFRKQNISELMIIEAMKYAKSNGGKYMEAYPVQADSPSYRFMGYISTFEKLGFVFIQKAGTRRHVMIHKL